MIVIQQKPIKKKINRKNPSVVWRWFSCWDGFLCMINPWLAYYINILSHWSVGPTSTSWNLWSVQCLQTRHMIHHSSIWNRFIYLFSFNFSCSGLSQRQSGSMYWKLFQLDPLEVVGRRPLQECNVLDGYSVFRSCWVARRLQKTKMILR